MNKSKKILLIFVIVLVIFSLSSCSRGRNKIESGAEQFEDNMKSAVKTAVSSISDVSFNEMVDNIKSTFEQNGESGIIVEDIKDETAVEEESTPENEFAYLVGFLTTENLKEQYTKIFGDEEIVNKAIKNLQKGVSDLNDGVEISEERSKEIQDKFQQRIDEINAVKAAENLKKAEEYLSETKQKEGVVETESGLQYEIIRQGGGPLAGKNAEVVVDYTMAAWNEDNIVDQGTDTHFFTQRLIDGANEGIALMNVGSIFKFYIHPSMGYGSSDMGDIAPNSPLIFTVTLKEIK